MKRLLLLVFLLAASTSKGQDTLHHYLAIRVTGNSFAVFSTASEPRVVPFDVEKGEENILIRSDQAYYQGIFGLVQEYEALGWSLFQVYDHRWIMRKPKQ